MRWTALLLYLGLATSATAQDTSVPWDAELIDPAGGADLVLPMPCGGGMAFQKVVVPADIDDPLGDQTFRMGQSQANTGYADYLRTAHLRGAFADAENGGTFYYIARYELTAAQYRALTGACDAPFTIRDRFAKGGLSWFEAVDLSRRYSEWLRANAAEALTAAAAPQAFVRLPTEEEWEYATRGGARIDSALFPARRFFAEGALGDFAHYQAAGQGRGKLRPVGLRAANPLGLFDVYGNAEELVEGPFRLNVIGRPHGQAGGIVTRGGSIDAEESQIYSAQRREYPPYNPRSGQALSGEFFGLRMVVSSHVITDARFDAIRSSWMARADAGGAETGDPASTLAGLLEEELDPRRRDALAALQHDFRVAQEEAQASRVQSAKSTLLSGAGFVAGLQEDAAQITEVDGSIKDLRDRFAITSNADQRALLLQAMRTNVERLTALRDGQRTGLLFYRTTLETLVTDMDADTRQGAYQTLARELNAAGLDDLLGDLNTFWGDVATYAGQPDMDLDALLSMALN